MRSTRAVVISSGFSHSTCTPRAAAASTGSRWAPEGVVTLSRSGRSASSISSTVR